MTRRVGSIDRRRDSLAHSLEAEVAGLRRPRPVRDVQPEPDYQANFIAGCAFLLGAAIVAVTLWALLAIWLWLA